ncbi:UDP-N-acetylmuramoyl-L-alanine--D-glutamate ligase [Hymenobacter taeanensis]|uniref:UDP-N-acetylmuramoylalanine--D-glutamate ligase n=1 Tax=Hymenobacter taeanensis TaxID=2735321 RepID=A0A6M6BJ06_9BACT|nr:MULTISPECIES: UDP-N-acetylmuramoyl-L-alanine--D-glutamate ligase [Hymenobacter]QJX47878.1 UDP-N-acetylmuramoyl-L-alanine--D-glutamate ligase [Hymenobacter taeanensis]UOQ82680.1 UDP-N-acetylmuramoyl-L-alanine--D-glutamate ligase [Hymenobacter sp. 5414T-23]
MAKIVILGAAESGVGAALLARAKGYTVFVSDRGPIQQIYKDKLTAAGIRFEENKHSIDELLLADEVVKSPGIPEKTEVIQALRERNIPIISEIELAGRYTKAKCICITGTNGKTTTTLLTYHLLKEAGFKVGLAGNVGYSLAEQVIEDKHEYYVVELSSFQLDDTYEFRPWISILLNITPDHLDRYGYSMEKYALAKLRIMRNQDSSGYFIYNADDEVIQRYFQAAFRTVVQMPFSLHDRPDYQLAAYYSSEDEICVDLLPGYYSKTEKIDTSASPLIGQHNRQNTMAAVLAARIADISKPQIEAALASFRNAEHRLQPVGEVKGARFVNDSKATNVEAAWFALDGIRQPIVWIAGGTDKGNDYSSLVPLVQARVKALICLGVDNEKLKAAFGAVVPHLEETRSMEAAVRRAAELASEGDVVLLSPACASFDLFRNYEDRGQQFIEQVESLMEA